MENACHMFKNLSDRLSQTLDRIRGQGRLSEENIKETLREIRMALLEADVLSEDMLIKTLSEQAGLPAPWEVDTGQRDHKNGYVYGIRGM